VPRWSAIGIGATALRVDRHDRRVLRAHAERPTSAATSGCFAVITAHRIDEARPHRLGVLLGVFAVAVCRE
jgi:hypothetical protein